MTSVEDFLAHHGVLGMKWGVRKKEPVSAEVQAKRDGKAQKYVKRAAAYDSAIAKLKKQKTNNRFSKANQNALVGDLTKQRDKALDDAQRKRDGRLSKGQRNLVIGAAVVGTLVATGVVASNVQSGEFNRLAQRGSAFLNGKKATDFAKNAKLAKPDLSIDEIQNEVVKQINPDFGAIGTKMNCRRATMAYEMRRRGNDVMATRTTNASGQTAIGLYNALNKAGLERPTSNYATVKQITRENANFSEKMFGLSDKSQPIKQLMKGSPGGAKRLIHDLPGEQTALSKAQAVLITLASQPERSRGEVSAVWNMGGGHSMAYEIIDGKANIIDSQSGKIFKTAEEMVKNLPEISQSGYTRLDNVPLNSEYLLRWLKNAK